MTPSGAVGNEVHAEIDVRTTCTGPGKASVHTAQLTCKHVSLHAFERNHSAQVWDGQNDKT